MAPDLRVDQTDDDSPPHKDAIRSMESCDSPGRKTEPAGSVVPLVPEASTDIPVPLTSIVGRERELAAIQDLLLRRDVRSLTLTGPGGVGKTRLALELAHHLRNAFSDGVCFVGLASITDAELLLSTICRALGMRAVTEASSWDRLRAFLRNRHFVLILDNFEHLVTAAPTVADLLAQCPRLTILATSRLPLGLAGEHEYAVQPLALPATHAVPTPAQVLASGAGSLFVDRARSVLSDFALDDANAAAVAEICIRVDGLPLAIELAAARSKVLAPREIVLRLDHRLPLLTGGKRDQPERLQTMRDSISWSYDFLSQEERMKFRRLAVFVGGFDLEGADAVCSSPVLDGIDGLVNHSLLQREAQPNGHSRFWMLETIREFASECLEESGETQATKQAHALFYLHLAEQHEVALWLPPEDQLGARFEADHANFRAALAWFKGTDQHAQFLRLAGTLIWYWSVRGHLREGQRYLEDALAAANPAAATIRGNAFMALGLVSFLQGDATRTERLYRAALDDYDALADRVGAAYALSALGALATYHGLYTEAERYLKRALAATDAAGESAVARSIACATLSDLGMVAHGLGRLEEAAERLDAAIAGYEALGQPWGLANALQIAGSIARDRGNTSSAMDYYRAALALARSQGNERMIATILDSIAWLAALSGDAERSARLLGAAAALREQMGLQVIYPIDRATRERAVAVARVALTAVGFSAAWAAGSTQAIGTAIADAETFASAPATASGSSLRDRYGLTARELEILRRIVRRETDREIASALHLSPRTVSWHVTNLLNKLGVDSRREAAELAIIDGITRPSG